MTLRTSITYSIAKWGLLVAGLYCLVYAIGVTILVMGPFRPADYSTNWGLGFADYVSKGIPFNASSPDDKIPAESFIMTTQFDNLKTEGAPADIYQPKPGQPGVAGRTIDPAHLGRKFYGPNPEYQPTIKAARVNEYTFYAWPEKPAQRLFLFLPQLLTWLGIAFCAWHLSRLMDNIVRHKVLVKQGYWRLVYVGFTIIIAQVLFFVWGITQPYRYFISIVSPFEDENLRLQGAPTSPFDLQWLAIGCVVLLLAKGFQRGNLFVKETP